MKKLLSWILILTMLLTALVAFSSCKKGGNDDDPDGPGSGAGGGGEEQVLTEEEVDTLLSATGDKMAALGDFHIVAALTVKTSQQGVTVEIPFTAEVKISGLNTENPALSLTFEGDIVEESISAGFYYKDGWAYLTEGDKGQKMQISIQEIFEMLGGMIGSASQSPSGPAPAPEYSVPSDENAGSSGSAVESKSVRAAESENVDPATKIEQLLATLFDDLMSKTTAVKLENGATEFRISFTVAEIVGLISDVMGDLVESGMISEEQLGEMIDADTLAGITQMVSGSGSVAVTVQNDYVTKIALGANASATVENQNVSFAANASIELVNPGQSVTVTLPEGAEDYEERENGSSSKPSGDFSVPADPDEAIAKLEAAGFEVTIGDSAENPDLYMGYTVNASKFTEESVCQIVIVYCEDEDTAEDAYQVVNDLIEQANLEYKLEMDGTIVWYTIGEENFADVFN